MIFPPKAILTTSTDIYEEGEGDRARSRNRGPKWQRRPDFGRQMSLESPLQQSASCDLSRLQFETKPRLAWIELSSVQSSKRGGRRDCCGVRKKAETSFYLFIFLILSSKFFPGPPCSILHYRFAIDCWLD